MQCRDEREINSREESLEAISYSWFILTKPNWVRFEKKNKFEHNFMGEKNICNLNSKTIFQILNKNILYFAVNIKLKGHCTV